MVVQGLNKAGAHISSISKNYSITLYLCELHLDDGMYTTKVQWGGVNDSVNDFLMHYKKLF